ncbi:hypothetical protein PENSPDRAFT_228923 [Peniophora sp. CONT]|nr:hypothetical protein PENSPDRAFT_228923 [Peniophora sp. CONT]
MRFRISSSQAPRPAHAGALVPIIALPIVGNILFALPRRYRLSRSTAGVFAANTFATARIHGQVSYAAPIHSATDVYRSTQTFQRMANTPLALSSINALLLDMDLRRKCDLAVSGMDSRPFFPPCLRVHHL